MPPGAVRARAKADHAGKLAKAAKKIFITMQKGERCAKIDANPLQSSTFLVENSCCVDFRT